MTKLQLEQYEKIAEAILFAGGEPVEQKTVAQAMELDEDAAVAVLESLKTKYEKFEGSIEVRRLETHWQLCTKAEYEPYIRGAFEIKRNAPLSQAALEVLAIHDARRLKDLLAGNLAVSAFHGDLAGIGVGSCEDLRPGFLQASCCLRLCFGCTVDLFAIDCVGVAPAAIFAQIDRAFAVSSLSAQ